MLTEHFCHQWMMLVLYFPFCLFIITLLPLDKRYLWQVLFFKNDTNNISGPSDSQNLSCTSSRCKGMSVDFELEQTVLTAQGSIVKVNLFSLWVKCGLRNKLYWPMWGYKDRAMTVFVEWPCLSFFVYWLFKKWFFLCVNHVKVKQREHKHNMKRKAPYF